MNKILLVSVVALSLGGCMSQRESNGALIGGASGAVIGGVATHSWGGAAIANLTGPHYAHRHCWWSRSAGRTVCRYW